MRRKTRLPNCLDVESNIKLYLDGLDLFYKNYFNE